MIYIVDRIEDNVAVLENKETKKITDVSLSLLPKDIKEGNVLKYENNTYILDKKEEEERKKAILTKFEKLKNKDIH